ncbi:MAG: SGNH/GDSL hydrolase family protein [bacterium]
MVIPERRGRLALFLVSFLLIPFLLLLAEVFVRTFASGIQFLGTDRALYREHAFGNTYGWVPNGTGVSFGAQVRINSRGFRDLGGPAEADSSLLLIGDSVTFGVGVDASSTFAGLIQTAHPSLNIINSAAIGYSIENYSDVMDYLLDRDSTIRQVIICYSLNDVEPSLSVRYDTPPFWNIRKFFREHSKLYLWMKATLFDRSEDYFFHDLELYQPHSQHLQHMLKDFSELVGKIRSKGIACSVLILPYEYQLRIPDERYLLPQRVISEFLSVRTIHYVDALPSFKETSEPSANFFLLGDHMHLSPRGHQVVFEVVQKYILN